MDTKDCYVYDGASEDYFKQIQSGELQPVPMKEVWPMVPALSSAEYFNKTLTYRTCMEEAWFMRRVPRV
jgi:hypothetical protein